MRLRTLATAGALVASLGCGVELPPPPCGGTTCPRPDAGVDAGPSYAVCVAGLQPSYSDINTRVFLVSCGTATTGCHSMAGYRDSGGLLLASDAYAHLVGVTSQNVGNLDANAPHPKRVAPGDPDMSM